ncbi:hypothetical protein P691DRAFT_592040 [Macrolepiota fuliginosa MF-IS2]|uniref:Uncharacterized protein n=1 Tax=Macrolepiota fuliginosa MF-IS2 TaxID=1400762 RepID=A0A9P5XCN5_9AGAR|nr:hypothetical protein P691DRAFT_592040 [Macrolepiota fuliginosa MF-IS2]
MEKYIGEINSRGESLYSSAATRLKQLPRAGIFEDLGSSFKPSQSKMLEKNQDTAGKKRTPSVHYSDSDFGSEDEMDCLSQNTEADEKTVLDKVKPTSGSRQLSSYHPDVLNGRSKTLKGLKFNKKKSMNVGVDVDVNVEEPLSSQYKPRAKAKESRRRDGTDIESADDEGTYKNTRKLKNTLSTSTLASTSNDAPTTARPKVRPRPITRPPPPSAGEDVDSLFGTSTKKTGTRTLSSIPPPSLSSSNKDSKCASPPYNADLSSGSLGSTSTTSSSSHPPPPSSSFTSTILSSGSGPRLPQKFPTFSPLNSPATKRSIAVAAKSFPDLSPLSKDKDKDTRVSKGKGRGKGKRKAVTRDLQPFPMSTQDLDGISALEEDDDSDVDVRHARKRRYQGDNEPLYVFVQLRNNMDPTCFIVLWTRWIYTKRKIHVRPISPLLFHHNLNPRI